MNPTCKQIKRLRLSRGLTQSQAAALVYVTLRQWQYYESGGATIGRALWELFQLKKILLDGVA